MREFEILPDPDDPRLSETVSGLDQDDKPIEATVVTERPLTLFLNAREIVTMMTIGDHADLLAVGYLLNQHMLKHDDEITAFYLTDFLVKQFDAFIWKPMGLDRHPQLLEMYFGNYTKLVYQANHALGSIVQPKFIHLSTARFGFPVSVKTIWCVSR